MSISIRNYTRSEVLYIEKNKAEILRLANDKDLGQVNFIEEKVSGKISWCKRKIANVL
jgi:hypothetical protein